MRDKKSKQRQETYNQVVIPELGRIAFPLQVLPDGQVIFFSEYPYRARVETHDIEQHAPHPEVKHASGLAKHAAQTVAGPLERAAVARDAERHLGLDQLDGALVQREEAEKIRVRRGVEDDLQEDDSGGWE